MDTPIFRTLRIAPTTQQGGTQTIQQAIYLTHDNPCGANLLIFQKMGLTGIRYIDLKNYLDAILKSEEMVALFEDIRVAATTYIDTPTIEQIYFQYLYRIMLWAEAGIQNLPVPQDYYPGYRFRVNVYDGSGTMIYDSYYPSLKVFYVDPATNLVVNTKIPVLPSNPYYWIKDTGLYKISSTYQAAFLNALNPSGFYTILSNFPINQSGAQETEMAVASLLVDSANTRSFGIPKYGFSARSQLSPFGGITYNCVNFIDIKTTPDSTGAVTLVESIFFRLSLEEDTYGFDSTNAQPIDTQGNESQYFEENSALKYLSIIHKDNVEEGLAHLQMLYGDDQQKFDALSQAYLEIVNQEKLVQSVQSVEPVEPVEPVESVEPVEPVESIESIESVESVEFIETTES